MALERGRCCQVWNKSLEGGVFSFLAVTRGVQVGRLIQGWPAATGLLSESLLCPSSVRSCILLFFLCRLSMSGLLVFLITWQVQYSLPQSGERRWASSWRLTTATHRSCAWIPGISTPRPCLINQPNRLRSMLVSRRRSRRRAKSQTNHRDSGSLWDIYANSGAYLIVEKWCKFALFQMIDVVQSKFRLGDSNFIYPHPNYWYFWDLVLQIDFCFNEAPCVHILI